MQVRGQESIEWTLLPWHPQGYEDLGFLLMKIIWYKITRMNIYILIFSNINTARMNLHFIWIQKCALYLENGSIKMALNTLRDQKLFEGTKKKFYRSIILFSFHKTTFVCVCVCVFLTWHPMSCLVPQISDGAIGTMEEDCSEDFSFLNGNKCRHNYHYDRRHRVNIYNFTTSFQPILSGYINVRHCIG